MIIHQFYQIVFQTLVFIREKKLLEKHIFFIPGKNKNILQR